MTADKRKRFEHIIRALQAKTVERGATEAEAMEAAAKAKELMDRYEIDELSDEEIVAEGAVRDYWVPRNMQEAGFTTAVGYMVGKFTDTQAYFVSDRGKKIRKLAVVGLKADVDFALFLYSSLAAFGVAGAASQPARERVRFMKGYGHRISQRLKEMDDKRKAANTGSRALVVVDLKTAAINKFMTAEKLTLRSGRRQVVTRTGSFEAGIKRGNQASFNRPVGGNQARLGYE